MATENFTSWLSKQVLIPCIPAIALFFCSFIVKNLMCLDCSTIFEKIDWITLFFTIICVGYFTTIEIDALNDKFSNKTYKIYGEKKIIMPCLYFLVIITTLTVFILKLNEVLNFPGFHKMYVILIIFASLLSIIIFYSCCCFKINHKV